jgi:Tfp pilus assembly protein FimT
MVTIAVIAVLTSFGIPRFMKALEQSRVDIAAANLRAGWTARRLYWLKYQTYADSMSSLIRFESWRQLRQSRAIQPIHAMTALTAVSV